MQQVHSKSIHKEVFKQHVSTLKNEKTSITQKKH